MTDEAHEIERAARDLIRIYGNSAVRFVRKHAEIVATLHSQSSAKKWHNIADAIERVPRSNNAQIGALR